MNEIGHIQWFPGHMTKAKRLIEGNLKMVDAVVEIVDARIPESSRNPVLDQLIANKARIIILNKSDYADGEVTKQWREHYQRQGLFALACDCRSGKGVNQFIPLLKKTLAELLEKRRNRGMIGKALRIMVVGIPNVGKSSFINRLSNSKKTKTADKPGVTRGKQWVAIDREIELLDMPGILWPKFDDQEVALKLAFTGAIRDEILDIEGMAGKLCEFMRENYPQRLKERYKLQQLDEHIIPQIAMARGMLLSGGVPDTLRASVMVIDEFRGGKIGRISFEKP